MIDLALYSVVWPSPKAIDTDFRDDDASLRTNV